MQITITNIQRIVTKYNDLCFEGKLPMPTIKLGNAKNYLGQLRCKKKKDRFGKITLYDFTLCVNTRYEMDEPKLEDVVIHEMIHYYISFNNIKDTSSHGIVFRNIMNDINHRFGRNIMISSKGSQPVSASSQEYKQHLVSVATLKDGTTATMTCARTRLFQIDEDLRRLFPIQNLTWYFTIEPYFNRFPRCTTAKLYRVDKEKLTAHLATALELERVGNAFRPKRK